MGSEFQLGSTEEFRHPGASIPAVCSQSAAVPVQVEFGAQSHVGLVRENNEDRYVVIRLSRVMEALFTNLPDALLPRTFQEKAYCLAVADGMGGMAGGEVASTLAIVTGLNRIINSTKWILRIDDQEERELIDRMSEHFRQLDTALTEHAEEDRSLFGMATTLVAAYSVGLDLFVIHAGDSRAYLFHDGMLERLTRDHTLAQAMLDAGHISAKDLENSRKRHMLTNFIGGRAGQVTAEIQRYRLAGDDCLLLCTDGLTEMLKDGEIADVLRSHETLDAASGALVKAALDRGGIDNVTVVLARYKTSTPGPVENPTSIPPQ